MTDRRKTAYEAAKRAKRLRRLVGQAIADYAMIGEGDRVMVCVSGGKDSQGLLDLLLALQAKAPVRFELVAVTLDQKQPGFPRDALAAYFAARGVAYRIVEQDTYSVVRRVIPEGKTYCSLCSRLRRGILYRVARELGATRIALGHHRDDVLATFFLNLFHGGQLKAMPAKLRSDDGRHVVIRPLVYCAEADLAAYAAERRFPIVPCTLCGSQPNLERRAIGALLADWERRHPGRIASILRALTDVRPSHLLDRRLYDFVGLQPLVPVNARAGAPRADRAAQVPLLTEAGDDGGDQVQRAWRSAVDLVEAHRQVDVECRADTREHLGAQPPGALADLALQPDRPAEDERRREAEQRVGQPETAD